MVPTTLLILINVLKFQLLRKKSFICPIIHEVNMHIIMSLSIQETPIGPCNHMFQQKHKKLFFIFLIGHIWEHYVYGPRGLCDQAPTSTPSIGNT
jgi:hypothetical protein